MCNMGHHIEQHADRADEGLQMDQVKDVLALADGVTDAWKSFEVAKVNGQNVRMRVMQDWTAQWHQHDDSDEAFFVLSGTFFLDTDQGTQRIDAGQFGVARAGIRHRGRVEGRATLLVIDGFAA
jgi:quercetin dioxygenase-like cupin family protein